MRNAPSAAPERSSRAFEDLRLRAHRLPRGLLDLEVEARGELDRAQDANRIFGEADVGVADGAQHAILEVVEPVDEVQDLLLGRIEEEPVHREVAATRVLAGRAEDVVLGDQQILVVVLGLGLASERCRLDDVRAVVDVHQTEASSDDASVAEEPTDLLGGRVRGDVEVLGDAPDHQVADAAADEVGLVAVPLESQDDAFGVPIERTRVDGVGRLSQGLRTGRIGAPGIPLTRLTTGGCGRCARAGVPRRAIVSGPIPATPALSARPFGLIVLGRFAGRAGGSAAGSGHGRWMEPHARSRQRNGRSCPGGGVPVQGSREPALARGEGPR